MYNSRPLSTLLAFCNANGLNLSDITLQDWKDGSHFATLIQTKDRDFKLPFAWADKRNECVKNYRAIMTWVHDNVSPLAGPHPSTIPDCAFGNAPIRSTDHNYGYDPVEKVAPELFALYALIHILSLYLSRASTSVPRGSIASLTNTPEYRSLLGLYEAGFIQKEDFEDRLAKLTIESDTKQETGQSAFGQDSSYNNLGEAEEEEHDALKCFCVQETCFQCYQRVKGCCKEDHEEICTARDKLCPYCQNAYFKGAALYQHMKSCMLRSTFNSTVHDTDFCKTCGYEYSVFVKENLEDTGEGEDWGHWCPKTKRCPICREEMKDIRELENHIAQCGHDSSQDNSGAYICFSCESSFRSRTNLEIHRDSCPVGAEAVAIMVGGIKKDVVLPWKKYITAAEPGLVNGWRSCAGNRL